MNTPLTALGRLLVGATFFLIGALPISVHAQGQSTTECGGSALESADVYYSLGLFDETVGTLKSCLPDGLEDKGQRVGAYRLMALSYIATDSLDLARESVRALLKTDSGYKSDPTTDPPLFADLIEAEQPPWYTFMWEGNGAGRWVGRIAVVGTGVAIPLILRDTSEPELPGPPALPGVAAQ